MNKRNKMNDFLKGIEQLTEKYILTADNIYVQLCNYGLSEYERGNSCEELFNNFVNYYKNNPNIRSFVAQNWSYFCQFRSETDDAITKVKPIKIYVPLKKEYLEKNVKKIMNFIIQNDIVHCSKLAKKIRADNLVLRVSTKEEADKIINYINSNINKNEMNEYNPFCISEGKVGLAIDGGCSYNSILSKYIAEYIHKCSQTNGQININTFEQYMQESLKKLSNPSSVDYTKFKDDRYMDDEEFLVDLKEITNLILANIRGQDKEYLYERYNKINNLNNSSYTQEKQTKQSKDELVEKKSPERIPTVEPQNLQNTKILAMFNDDQLMINLIKTMTAKYGKKDAKILINNYKQTYDPTYITRDNNLRNLVMYSPTFNNYIRKISEKQLEDLINKYASENQYNQIIENQIENICKSNYFSALEKGYDPQKQVAVGLIRMTYGDYSYITRANNARSQAQNINPKIIAKTIKQFLQDKGYEIQDDRQIYLLYSNYIEYICNNPQQRQKNRY